MAHYEHLPIYKKTMDVAVYFEKIVKDFGRYHKYTLGSELRKVSSDIVKLIIKANSASEKLSVLTIVGEEDFCLSGIKTWVPTYRLVPCWKNQS